MPTYIYLVSEAVIQRRYPLESATVHAELTSRQILRGAHLIVIAGCTACHGPGLEGRMMHADLPLQLYAGNLLRFARTMSDGELERAIRYASRPDATSLWGMPSGNFAYLSEDDVASIISYLRSRPPAGVALPAPQFDFAARVSLLRGAIKPAFLIAADSPPSLDLGPRYGGGRYLARIACAECHGTDLQGQGGSPDLAVVSLYNRSAFFALLRQGRGASGRIVPAMRSLARIRFHTFADYEILALYEYLIARAHAPRDIVVRAEALRRHEESEKLRGRTEQ
ncbi:MAG TPA: hypothetical protein VII49_02330 [Rhizomicrobium sp.]